MIELKYQIVDHYLLRLQLVTSEMKDFLAILELPEF